MGIFFPCQIPDYPCPKMAPRRRAIHALEQMRHGLGNCTGTCSVCSIAAKKIVQEAKPIFIVVENFFCLFFSFEWLMRFMSFRRKCDGTKDAWFCFDSIMVAMMVKARGTRY